MPRPSNSAARRAQIADGLICVLAQGAFHDVSVTDIARAAGLKPGLVHYHFATKDEVLPLAVERLTLRLATRIERRARTAVSAEGRLCSLLDGWLARSDVGDAHPDDDPEAVRAWATIGAEAMFRPAVASLYREALTRAHSQLHEAAVAVVGVERAVPLAGLLMAFIEGALRMGAAGAEVIAPGDAAPLARHLVRVFMATGLSARPWTSLDDDLDSRGV
jgi:TetR/AcrR family transcriptional repressor of bet genes